VIRKIEFGDSNVYDPEKAQILFPVKLGSVEDLDVDNGMVVDGAGER